MIDTHQLVMPGAVALAVLLALLVALTVRRRASERAYVHALNERGERLALALWATGEHYWDYHVLSGRLRRLVGTAHRNDGERLVEDTLPVETLLHPDDVPLARDALARCMDETASRFELQVRVADGGRGWRWMRARGRVVERDRAGAVLRIAGTALNVTGTREAERERRIAAEVLRSMSEAVAVVDADFRYVSVNPAFLRMTGYSEGEIIGRHGAVLDSAQHDAAFHEEVRTAATQAGQWSGELWQRRKDGEEFLAAVEMRTVHEADLGTPLQVVVLNDITQHKRTEQELRYLANFDTLTSLPNRALLSERLSRAIIHAHRHDTRVAVLFIDLDRFKDVNDALGHAAGDRILRAAATRLQQTVGARHTVARLGGDEFTIVIEDLDHPTQVDRIAEALIDAFEAPLLLDDRREITISPSIGISLYPDHAQVPTELLKQADTAMYQAKDAGRRTYMRYDDNMDIAVRQRATISSALRKVLDRGELRVVFQPRLSLASARVTGVEALLRWTSPEHGDIPPGDFIPIAEESGLIMEIGEWVLREACMALGRWRQHGLTDLTMSVNVSVLQLLRGDFPEVVRRVLTDTGIPPARLELELTESVLMANAEQTAEKLHAFRQLGVSLAIDDFGTGYSSLAYLKRLPIDTLKIDKAFIDGLPDDADDVAITSTVVTMSRSLGLNVVAEGVETEAQMRFLAGIGCDEIQGFWVARPLDALHCLAFIRTRRPAHATAGPAPSARVASLP